ncbi:transglutaminase-like domain-containing protein [Chamaesiphon minutus]|uniref:Transglutaminase-like enzyme, predicted cysteine protease n=1 Tax=Chamaesiphon minutus (strain ATCC 27169 / PCC 6605) TaxID=1173020 RepID=K9UHL8_CHAP6|nr:transglutaminase-like domain-containing protein [Chamaesiphon minutus]AFY94148.1 transglutaminase-like enzyme, predicted cysteine protease [Chamaesiphon minutus PCC 6605]
MKISISSLCSLAICLWGFQTGLWGFAAIVLLALEGRRFVRSQWDLSFNQLKNIGKLWGILALGSIVFLLIAYRAMFIYSLLQWLPFLCLPLVIGQTYVNGFTTLLPLLSNDSTQSRSAPPRRARSIAVNQNNPNFYYPYFAICLIAASTSNRHDLIFYGATVALVGLFLWNLRPRQAHPAIWLCLLILAGAIGFGGQLQLHQLQAKLEEQVAPLLSGFTGESIDPYQAQTQVGSIGDLKQSNEIIFRVAGNRQQFPLLLREATYNKYQSPSWVALKSKFTPVLPQSDGSTWQLGASQTKSTAISISSQLNRGKAILRLPHSITQVDRLNVEKMMQNQYGTVKVRGQGNSLTYQAHFNPDRSLDTPPTDADLHIPAAEQPAIAKTLQNLDVKELPADRVLDRLSNFFTQNFRYSLKLAGSGNPSTPLSAFLLKQRAGHCEYFATATTLLLRGAGIPARYVVGYSVREWSPLEQQFVIRSRHAHAWTMAYTNGNWQSFDTTPPDWAAQEDAMASPFQTISDLWSFLSFQFSRGLAHIVAGKTTILLWTIAVGGLFLLWRFRRRWRLPRSLQVAIVPEQSIPIGRSGLDSEFYEIDRALQNLGLHRLSSESFQQWLLRIEPHLAESQYSTLKQILDLHHCYRFDPQGLSSMERQQLQELSQSWLDYFASYSPVTQCMEK